MSTITSDEVNYLIYRYFQEAGYPHSAYTFGLESTISKNDGLRPETTPPGQLIALLQKGLHYSSMEAHLTEDGSEKVCSKAFNILEVHVCEKPTLKTSLSAPLISSSNIKQAGMAKDGQKDNGQDTQQKKRKKESPLRLEKKPTSSTTIEENIADFRLDSPSPLPQDAPSMEASVEIPEDHVTILAGHESEVISCAWNPQGNWIASGSGDATARIWSIEDLESKKPLPAPIVLSHLDPNGLTEESRDVTTLNWNPQGTLLATGCYDGRARLWTPTGQLVSTMIRHRGPIFSLKFSPSGEHLLSGGFDRSAVVWNAANGAIVQAHEDHTAPTLDVDWRDDKYFATCSTDRDLNIYEIGELTKRKSFEGHKDEVNAVRWSPDGQLLASCSDDATVKLWKLDRDAPIHTFIDHTMEIYTIKWSSISSTILASASFDATVRIYDLNLGRALYTLRGHTEPVYAISFSADGRLIASGSLDQTVKIWEVNSGKLARTFTGRGGVFELDWAPRGSERLVAATSESTLCVLDLRI